MHSAILYAIMPSDQHKFYDESMLLRAATVKAEEHRSVKRLGDFVWEVNFREAPEALALLVHAFEQRKLPYAILPIDGEPQWIRRNPEQK